MISAIKEHAFKTTGIVPARLNSTCRVYSYGGSYPQIFIYCLVFYFCSNAGVSIISSDGISINPK